MKTGLLGLLLVLVQGLRTDSHALPPSALEGEVRELIARSSGHATSARDSAALLAREDVGG